MINTHALELELIDSDFMRKFELWKDDDGVYSISLPKSIVFSYSPVRCVYAHGLFQNSIEYKRVV